MGKPKIYHIYGIATDKNGIKRYVTVVGKFEQKRERKIRQEVVPVETKPNCLTDGILTYEEKQLSRKLTLGVAFCHPNDEFDENIGVKVALRRIENGEDVGTIETHNVTMLTEDAIMAELFVKLNHICETIDEYIY